MPEYHNIFKFKNQQVLELRFHEKFCEMGAGSSYYIGIYGKEAQ
jgi:hypothetical protein